MENASKALIIAGAILISILLISVGVIIMNSTGNVNDQVKSSADTMALRSFNEQFTVYEGEFISASQVKALITLVQTSNKSNGFKTEPSEPKTDKFVYFDKSEGCITKTSQVKTNKTYTVSVEEMTDSGYVNRIKISAN